MHTKTAVDSDHYLQQLVTILQESLAEIPCQVYLFGSRAEGTAQPGSDVDIAVWAEQKISLALSRARLALEV